MFAIRTDITCAFSGQLRSNLCCPLRSCSRPLLLAGKSILIAPNKVLLTGAAMLDLTKDIQSLTTFRRQSGDFMKQLKKTKRPVVLTVNGKAAAVVQDGRRGSDPSGIG